MRAAVAPGGAARTASATCKRPTPWPDGGQALPGQRVEVGVAREPRVERLEPLRGLQQQSWASLPRFTANAIWARSTSTWAHWNSVSGPESAMATNPSATSRAPAWYLA